MANIVLLADDLDGTEWELVRNELDDVEEPIFDSPEARFVGVVGDSVFTKYLQDTSGNPLQLFMRVTWTALDHSFQFVGHRAFDPEIKILDAQLLDADEPIFLLDEPNEAPDPEYTWQEVFLDDTTYLVTEALDANYKQLFYEV